MFVECERVIHNGFSVELIGLKPEFFRERVYMTIHKGLREDDYGLAGSCWLTEDFVRRRAIHRLAHCVQTTAKPHQ